MIDLGLSPEQLEDFQREGVLCIPDFISSEQVRQLVDRSHELLEGFDLKHHPKTQFKTNDNDHIGDNYFFDSSDKVSFFFDVDAFDEDTGELRFPKDKAINKVGHGLHMKDKLFHDVTFSDKVKAVAKSLGYVDPRVLQSMCIFKQPQLTGKGRENSVPSHTDGTFLFTEPQSAVGFWFALEDCSEENGCLSYNPGSHKLFPITKRFVKKNGGRDGCGFIPVDFDPSKPIPDDNPEDYKLVECKAGSLVLIHNSVLHKSEKNVSDRSRYAYTFHVIDGTTSYDNLNWLQVPPCEAGGTEFSKLYDEK